MMRAVQGVPESTEPMAAREVSRVGPNAAIQLGNTLQDELGETVARHVFGDAGLSAWLADPPTKMIDQAQVARLFRALFARLPRRTARTIAAQAGARTADYLLNNRIPKPAHAMLRVLPASVSASLLLRAITRNAWTFAGSGTFSAHNGLSPAIEIAANPIAMPGCVWHVGVFERLFQVLVTSRTSIFHTQCCHDGASACRFEIVIDRQMFGRTSAATWARRATRRCGDGRLHDHTSCRR